MIKVGQSGYCECQGGVRRGGVGCKAPSSFTCSNICWNCSKCWPEGNEVATVLPNGTIYVKFSVTNTGLIAGTEVAQVYVADDIASIVTANKQLQGFARVELAPNQTKEVMLPIDVASQLRLLNREWEWVVEPGSFTVQVSRNAATATLHGSFEVVDP